MRFLLFTLICVFCVQQAWSKEAMLDVVWAQLYEAKTTLDPYEDNLLGDSIDPQTGRLSFSALDVSLPGNSALEVAIRRRIDYSQIRQNDMGP